MCKRSFPTREAMKQHASRCTWCERCKKYVEKRHLLTCTGRERSGPQLYCNICHVFRSKKSFKDHMKRRHGVENWRRRDHPEVLSEVSSYLFSLKSMLVGGKKRVETSSCMLWKTRIYPCLINIWQYFESGSCNWRRPCLHVVHCCGRQGFMHILFSTLFPCNNHLLSCA